MASKESGSFKMSHGSFALKMFLTFGKKWAVLLSVAALIAMLAGVVFDLRFIIVGFAIILLIMPALAGWLYYYYGLREECFVNVFPHTVSFTDDEIIFTVTFPPLRNPEQNEEPDGIAENKAEDQQPQEAVVKKYHFPLSALSGTTIYPDGLLVKYGIPPTGFFWLPEKEWEEKSMFTEICNQLLSPSR